MLIKGLIRGLTAKRTRRQQDSIVRFVFIVTLSLILGCWLSIAAYAAETPSIGINAKASLLMEAETGKILLEENAHERLAPASVTKVMTILLIYESLEHERIKWDDVVTVSAHAASMGGSQIYLEAGERQTVRDLTKSIVVASANDSSVAMAEFIAGSEEAFVIAMNEKAKSLGMENTHFINACGLDKPGHETSAYDIALMSRELILKYPEVLDFAKIWMDSITHKTARGETDFGLTNTNKLIRSYTGATGLKTGSTSEALFCISATAEKEGMKLISVVLGAPDPTTRFDSAKKMFDYGYANYALAAKEPEGTAMGEIKIFKGKKETVPVVIKEQTHVLIPKGKNIVVDGETKIMDSLNAPVGKDRKAGEVIYTCEGREVGRSDLIVPEEIGKASAHDMMGRLFKRWMVKGEY
jgi:D-alanyl-D-alanine carboxypeptidase (penicillin-binding protein 5/6)